MDGTETLTGVDVKALRVTFFQFLSDLTRCVYCQPVDNVTVATPTPLIEVSETGSSVTDLQMHYSNSSVGATADANADSSRIYGDSNALQDAGGLGIKLLERVYHLMNKNSVIGARVDKYLKAHFGYGLPETPVVGRNEFMCDISDIFATTQNNETYLGEFAGKGIGVGKHSPFNFETDHCGYLISLLCVVPIGGYVQGAKIEPIERYDFYNSEWDSLGMAPTSMYETLGRSSVLTGASDATRGFVPRYFQLKVKNNLANGGFDLRSKERSSCLIAWIGFSLKKIITLMIQVQT